MSLRRAAVLATIVLAVALAACAGDDQASSSIDVTATEFAFEPDAWMVPADTDVSVTMQNEGTIEHEWVVLREAITSEDEFSEDLVEFEIEATPGEQGSGSFSLPAGSYQVVCAVPGHFAAGMEGELTVQ